MYIFFSQGYLLFTRSRYFDDYQISYIKSKLLNIVQLQAELFFGLNQILFQTLKVNCLDIIGQNIQLVYQTNQFLQSIAKWFAISLFKVFFNIYT